ncbi:MAG TPA: hypothetical protein VIN76_00320 [Parasphingorhabdus sp.]
MSSSVAFLIVRWQISSMPKPQPPSEKQRKEAEKAERLAEQLRANLRRRKAQSRNLQGSDPD